MTVKDGIGEAFVAGAEEGDTYKFCIRTQTGSALYKADSFAFYEQQRPQTASRLYELDGFSWTDELFLSEQNGRPTAFGWISLLFHFYCCGGGNHPLLNYPKGTVNQYVQ